MYKAVAGIIKKISFALLVLAFILGLVLGGTYKANKSFNWALVIGAWTGGFLFYGICYAVGAMLDLQSRTVSLLEGISSSLAAITDKAEGSPKENLNVQQATETDLSEKSAENQSTTFIALDSYTIKCSDCGEKQSSDRTRCWQCGKSFKDHT